MGSHSSPTREVFLDNVEVPKENLLGKPGGRAKIVFSSMNHTRLSAAAGDLFKTRCVLGKMPFAGNFPRFVF